MVDKVGMGPGYGYPQVSEKKVNTNAAGTGEKFQLDYGKEGAIYEPSSEALKRQQAEKSTATKAKPRESVKAEDEGVHLTLFKAATEQTEKTQKSDLSVLDGILGVLTGAVNKAIEVIKGVISRIWNDESKVENTAEVTAPEPAKAEMVVTEKPKTQFEKAKAEAEEFLASSEGKKVARNSDLLTYYDKRGTVIHVSPSDRQRILYGDRNQIKV